MYKFALAAVMSIMATISHAEMIKVASPYSVEESLNRLTVAVEGAGATVFARIEHAKGAEMVGKELAPMARSGWLMKIRPICWPVLTSRPMRPL
jgi:4-diphosphocytidyl-2C-methyl-D-erythritol kinase